MSGIARRSSPFVALGLSLALAACTPPEEPPDIPGLELGSYEEFLEQPAGGDGQAEGGDPEGTEPEGGEPEGGDPDGEGDPEGADPDAAEGDPEEGDPEAGDPDGDPEEADPEGGDPEEGEGDGLASAESDEASGGAGGGGTGVPIDLFTMDSTEVELVDPSNWSAVPRERDELIRFLAERHCIRQAGGNTASREAELYDNWSTSAERVEGALRALEREDEKWGAIQSAIAELTENCG